MRVFWFNTKIKEGQLGRQCVWKIKFFLVGSKGQENCNKDMGGKSAHSEQSEDV